MTQPPTLQPVSISRPPRGLLVASRLCSACGAFLALIAVVLVSAGASPTLDLHPVFWASVEFVTGVAYFIAGYLLSKARRL